MHGGSGLLSLKIDWETILIYLILCRFYRQVCKQASKRNGLFQNRSELRAQNQQVFRYIKLFRNYNRFASTQKARSFVIDLFNKFNFKDQYAVVQPFC